MIGLLRRLALHTVIVVLVLVLGFATGVLIGRLWPPPPPVVPAPETTGAISMWAAG